MTCAVTDAGMHFLNMILQMVIVIRLIGALVAYELSVSLVVLLQHVTFPVCFSETCIVAMLTKVPLDLLMNRKDVIF